MMLNISFSYYLKHNYQELIIKGINQYPKPIDVIIQKYLHLSPLKITHQRAHQFIIMIIIQHLFGLTCSKVHSILLSKDAQILNKYISNFDSTFPCRSSSYIYMKLMYEMCKNEFDPLIVNIQDYFYVTIGENARKQYAELFRSTRKKVTPTPETLMGLVAPSQLFPNIDVHNRGVLIPFFNARLYQHAKHISGTNEIIGDIKEPDINDDTFTFRLAGKLGFIAGPPGKHKFYENFSFIDSKIQKYEKIIDDRLSADNIQDFTVISVDCCNIPVDKRDLTASKGTGSRGTFFGHKTSIGAGSYCLPFNSITVSGRTSDSTLFDATFTPIETLAHNTDRDIWVGTADAAYFSFPVIDRIEQADAIPFIDINPRNSQLLLELKQKSTKLARISKKALKSGLTLLERKQWVGEARCLSFQMGCSLPLVTKKRYLQKLLRKYAARARYNGLPPVERLREKQLRRQVMKLRAKIRKHGTPAEKKLGLSFIAHGTIEWFLVYGIRGQNEGINGIIKKRDNLIGDGQHTTWIIGNSIIKNRIHSNIVYIKSISLVYFIIMGLQRHCMRRIYNWRKEVHFFVIIFFDRFCRKNPKKSQLFH